MRWACKDCHWSGSKDEFLRAPNPFNKEETILGCPYCGQVGDFYNQCDEPGCREEATCGFPTANGYRRTCSQHSEWAKRPRGATEVA